MPASGTWFRVGMMGGGLIAAVLCLSFHVAAGDEPVSRQPFPIRGGERTGTVKPQFLFAPFTFCNHRDNRQFTVQDLIEPEPGERLLVAAWEPAVAGTKNPSSDTDRFVMMTSADNGRNWNSEKPFPGEGTGIADAPVNGSLLLLRSGTWVAIAGHGWPSSAGVFASGAPMISSSRNDGRSWSPPRPLLESRDRFAVLNQRLIQLKNGRLLLPAVRATSRSQADRPETRFDSWETTDLQPAYSLRDIRLTPGVEYADAWQPVCFFSDDEGETWRLSRDLKHDPQDSGFPATAAAQTPSGRVVMLICSSKGVLQSCFSNDGGETWGDLRNTTLTVTATTLNLTALPDGRLLAIFNAAEKSYEHRILPGHRLAYAVSPDDGVAWSAPATLDEQPGQQLLNPAVLLAPEGIMIVYSAIPPPAELKIPESGVGIPAGGGKICMIAYPPR